MSTTVKKVYFVAYRAPHHAMGDQPDKDLLQVIKLDKKQAREKLALRKEIYVQQRKLEAEFPQADPDVSRPLYEEWQKQYSSEYEKRIGPLQKQYDSIDGERLYYITPMGQYVELPIILDKIPNDFRTEHEFWDEKKYW